MTEAKEQVYTLRYPYTTPAGQELKEVVLLDRLTAGNLREVNRRTSVAEDYEFAGVSVLCGVPMEDIMNMDAEDYLALRELFFRRVGISGRIQEG